MSEKPEKSKEVSEREELEAQLMGGEVAELEDATVETSETAKDTTEIAEQAEVPEEDIETIREKLAKLQEERNSLQQAMREEREAKKQSEKTMAALLDRIEEAQKEKEARVAAAQAQEHIPNREDDPAGFIQWQQEQTLKEVRELKQERQEERSLTKQEQQQQAFLSEYQRLIDDYAQKTPDYNDAAQFLAKCRDEELQALGIDDQKERMSMLHQDALQIGAFCMQKGRNPAQTFYELAKKRGYLGQKPVETQQAGEKPAVEPKSLTTIGGRTPGNAESLQARADRIINTTRWDDLVGLDEKEIDKVLRQIG